MSDLKTIESEIENFSQQAKAAQEDAAKSRIMAEHHRAEGDTTRAQYENSMAMKKQKEATDFASKAQQLQKQAMSLRQEAELVQKQISDLQDKLANINGVSRTGII